MQLLVQALIRLYSRPSVILKWFSRNMLLLNTVVPGLVEPFLPFSLQNYAIPSGTPYLAVVFSRGLVR